MKLYRRTYRGPRGGQRTCKTWSCEFFVDGTRHRHSLKTRDHRAAELKAAELQRKAELRAAGVSDPYEDQVSRPLDIHLEEFETTLRARGCVEQYVRDRMACLQEFIEATKPLDICRLDAAAASKWLKEVRAARGLSARTINRRYQSIRQFAKWLVDTRRLGTDPFETLKPLNEKADRRHVRRALTAKDLGRLIQAAAQRPLEAARAQRKTKGVTDAEAVRLTAVGRTRALAYALAAGTGLRRGELKRLRWRDVDVDTAQVTVPAASAKSRRDQSVPLRADLVGALQAYRPSEAKSSETVFAKRSFPSLRAFKRDLVAAGLATVERKKRDENGRKYKQPREVFDTADEDGRVIDFHSLRYTFVTALAQAGVHPRTAQALARHAKIETTMETYTDLRLLDLQGAVEQLALPTVTPTVTVGEHSSASGRTNEPQVGEEASGRKPSKKAQRTAMNGGGRYWTRTSDPQLVELVL